MKTVLVTGAARRLGAAIARRLHADGFNIVIHYHNSRMEAESLLAEFNELRPGSASAVCLDLADIPAFPGAIARVRATWGRLDALVNNASQFFATPIGEVAESDWDALMASNLKGPFFLSQAATPHLREAGGAIVNLADYHALHPLPRYPVYCAAKAGLLMLTRSLAMELGPRVRVNAVAPGAILWPETGTVNPAARQRIVESIALKRTGQPGDIAALVRFLLSDDANYITGQVLGVDGGRGLGSISTDTTTIPTA